MEPITKSSNNSGLLEQLESAREGIKSQGRIPLCVISGSAGAREKFHAPLREFLCTLGQSCVIMDASVVPSLRSREGVRYILVCGSLEELRSTVWKLGGKERVCGKRTLIIAMAEEVEEQTGIRMYALKELDGTGMVIPMKGSTRGLRVFAMVVKGWGEAVGDVEAEEVLRKACGEPAVLPDEDLVLPPGWDSEEKVRTGVEAVGKKLEEVLEKVWVEGEEKEDEKEQVRIDEDEEKKIAEIEHAKVHLEGYEGWLDKLEKIGMMTMRIGQGEQGHPGMKVEDIEVGQGEVAPPQGDFFQKLLAGAGRG